MTREEAIRIIGWLKCTTNREDDLEAIDMAIEALSQPIVAKHFDIQSGYIYCSPQIAENVKVVVRCKDCRYCTEHYDRDGYPYWMCKEWDGGTDADGFCHCGERREPTIPMFKEAEEAYKAWTGEDIGCKSFTADEWYRQNFKDGEAE